MIAIRDFEMPKTCSECPFLQFDYGNNQTLVLCESLQRYMIYESGLFELLNNQRMKDCPLIEVEECEEK